MPHLSKDSWAIELGVALSGERDYKRPVYYTKLFCQLCRLYMPNSRTMGHINVRLYPACEIILYNLMAQGYKVTITHKLQIPYCCALPNDRLPAIIPASNMSDQLSGECVDVCNGDGNFDFFFSQSAGS